MRDRVRQGIADLHPAYAAVVMATGIVSTGLRLFGWQVLSDILLAVAAAALVLLVVAYAWRSVAFPERVRTDARNPGKAFGYFSLVAAPNVLANRLALDGHLLATAALAAASVPLWLLLTYTIPGDMMVGHRREPVLPRTNGSWFMWVVGTQSLAGVAAAIAAAEPDLTASFAPLAVALWGVGVVLYLMLVGLVTIRLLDDPVTPHALSPTYWVYMGATAISVLAAAGILALPASLPVIAQTRHVVSGLAFLLWAFGTWWIPLLLSFGVRRHLVEREPVGYEPTLWSMVFPLGMYGAASASYGRVTGLDFMVDIARVEIWIGFAAWVAVAITMGRSFRSPRAAGTGLAHQHEAPGDR
ncbi:tellurite resistance/C4-dicarboxylate transporter family protein [Streptomyces odontomachi]|uniref:tellurite resistance/C4-dicarboxylate transporter family protein n=1 Tax=Streptomyces odontomachi TaxID=2944940 RepID=UPI002109D5F6|nr:tellurite resistance/C4-dicarboxylate transporter family protein [Streptomyces sp. ODS25]